MEDQKNPIVEISVPEGEVNPGAVEAFAQLFLRMPSLANIESFLKNVIEYLKTNEENVETIKGRLGPQSANGATEVARLVASLKRHITQRNNELKSILDIVSNNSALTPEQEKTLNGFVDALASVDMETIKGLSEDADVAYRTLSGEHIDLGTKMEENHLQLLDSLGEICKRLAALEKIVPEIQSLTEGQNTTNATLQQVLEGQASISTSLENLIKSTADIASIQETTTKLADVYEQIVSKVDGLSTQITEGVSGLSSQMEQHNSDTSAKLNGVEGSIKQLDDGVLTRFTNLENGAAVNTKSVLDRLGTILGKIKTQGGTINMQTGMLNELIGIANNLTTNTETIISALENQGNNVETAEQRIISAVGEQGAVQTQALHEAKENLVQELSKHKDGLIAVINALQNTSNNAQTTEKNGSTANNNGTVVVQVEGLEDVLKHVQALTSVINNHINNIADNTNTSTVNNNNVHVTVQSEEKSEGDREPVGTGDNATQTSSVSDDDKTADDAIKATTPQGESGDNSAKQVQEVKSRVITGVPQPKIEGGEVNLKEDEQKAPQDLSGEVKKVTPKKKTSPKRMMKAKYLDRSYQETLKYREPKKRWYARFKDFIGRHPLASTLIGGAIGLGIGFIAGPLPYLHLGFQAAVMGTSNALLGSAIAGVGTGLISSMTAKLIQGRKGRLYNKFKKQKAKCDRKDRISEHVGEWVNLVEENVATLREKEKKSPVILKALRFHRLARKINRKALKGLRVWKTHADNKYNHTADKALKTKLKLNELEANDDKTLAMAGYLQKKKKKQKAHKEGKISTEDYEWDMQDISDDFEELTDGGDITGISDEARTFDVEAEEIIGKVKGAPSPSHKAILDDINRRNRKVAKHEVFEAPYIEPDDVKSKMAELEEKGEQEAAARLFHDFMGMTKKRKDYEAWMREQGKVPEAPVEMSEEEIAKLLSSNEEQHPDNEM